MAHPEESSCSLQILQCELDTSLSLFYDASQPELRFPQQHIYAPAVHGGVAQSVERGSHKPYVGGSSPPAATNPPPRKLAALSPGGFRNIF